MSLPAVITFQAIASVTGQATGVPGTATLTLYDYKAELGLLDAEIKLLATALTAMSAELALNSAELVKIQNFLLAVQSPTGDFRTVSPEDVANTTLVTTALASNVPPIPVTPESTS